MKRFKSIVAAAVLMSGQLAYVTIIPATAVVSNGCATSKQTVAYKTVSSVHVGVDTALKAWLQYVKVERERVEALPAGSDQNEAVIKLATQEVAVRKAIIKYQAAAEKAHLAVDAALANNMTPVPATMATAGTELVTAVNTFTK